jgi:hypothetical protein
MEPDMSQAPQGPGWWQASDGRWYPPHTHPSYRPPVQHGHAVKQPGFGPVPHSAPPRPGGVPKGLIVVGAIVLVVAALGYVGISYATGLVGDRLESAVGGDCTLVAKDDLDSVMGGEFDLIQLGGLTSIATVALDNRVLADATTCWATEAGVSDDSVRLVRIARLDGGGDAQARFQQERTLAQGVKEDRGGGITVESQPYFNKDVSFGDEAFCTTTDMTGASGVLVRRGSDLVYVSLTSGGIPRLAPDSGLDPNGAIKFADDDAHCELARKLADKVG